MAYRAAAWACKGGMGRASSRVPASGPSRPLIFSHWPPELAQPCSPNWFTLASTRWTCRVLCWRVWSSRRCCWLTPAQVGSAAAWRAGVLPHAGWVLCVEQPQQIGPLLRDAAFSCSKQLERWNAADYASR